MRTLTIFGNTEELLLIFLSVLRGEFACLCVCMNLYTTDVHACVCVVCICACVSLCMRVCASVCVLVLFSTYAEVGSNEMKRGSA